MEQEQKLRKDAEDERQSAAERKIILDIRMREEQERIFSENAAKRPGAKIGMTTQQVIYKTNWGKPLQINTTTTAHGRSEQWVYEDNKYLYFKNDRLVAIQN